MSVETAPAPAPVRPSTPPAAEEERVHSGFFWWAIVALLIGGLFIGASRVWASRAPSVVTFPLFDRTAVMSGSVTLHADPDTLAPLQTPAVKHFDDVRRIQSPGLLHSRELLVTTDTVTVGDKKVTLVAQYMVDNRTLKNLATPQAWSFAGTNPADRSAAYSVNLPLDGGSGPFDIWLNEADRAYTFTQVGQPFDRDGLTLVRLQGHLDPTPVDPLYIAQISRGGLPEGATLHELQRAVTANLPGPDVATLSDPIPLDYTMTADTRLLVEPRTGTIVAVEKMDESFTAHADATHVAAVRAVLDAHPGASGVAAARSAVDTLAARGDSRMFDISYAQNPASVTSMSDYAASQRDWISRMTRVIPTTLFAVGLGLLAVGLFLGLTAWRRRNLLYEYWWEED